MRRRFLLTALSALVLGAFPSRGLAETVSICEAAESDDYLTKASGQFLRGASNIGFCWTELIQQPAIEARTGGNILYGVLRGVGYTAVRAVKGVGEIATFPAPHRDPDGVFAHVADDCAFGAAGLEPR